MKRTSGQQQADTRVETVHQHLLRTMKAELDALDVGKFSNAAYLLTRDIKRVQELVDFPEEVTA